MRQRFILNEADDIQNNQQGGISVKSEQSLVDGADEIWDQVQEESINELEEVIRQVIKDNIRDIRQCDNMNELMHRDSINLLITGPAGTGKSSIVIKYLESLGMNPVVLTGAELTPIMVQGGMFKTVTPSDNPGEPDKVSAKMLTIDFLKRLNEPKSVLIVDEINRSRKDLRAFLLDTITSHKIPDSTENSNRFFAKNFICTIAMQNPANLAYGMDPRKDGLDNAMNTRFRHFEWESSPTAVGNYLKTKFGDLEDRARSKGHEVEAAEYHGMLLIAQYLFEPGSGFQFGGGFADEVDNQDAIWNQTRRGKPTLNPRSLTTAILASDGDVYRFLGLDHNGIHTSTGTFEACCGDEKMYGIKALNDKAEMTTYVMVKNILLRYEDKLNKQNEIIKQAEKKYREERILNDRPKDKPKEEPIPTPPVVNDNDDEDEDDDGKTFGF